jgi:glutathione S-transferase-like protein
VKLYVCWTTIQTPRPPRGHPCHNAYQALRDAGYEPDVVKARGLGIGPKFMHVVTDERREVERLTGRPTVPVLVTDDGEVIAESQRIVEWAKAHPAPAPSTT